MDTYIRSALNQIKAEDDLIEKTEKYLRSTIFNKKDEKLINFKMRSVFSMKKFAIAACAAVLVFGLSIGGYAYYKTPMAYLSLDINPSVELGVNAFNNVVSATGYNDDGKTILEGQNIFNLNIQNAVNKLVKSASDKGFIASDGSTIVSVTSQTNNATTASNLVKDAEQGANDAIKATGNTAVVYNDNIALTRRDEARELGITPGKLNLIQKLQSLDPTVTVEQYKDAKVTEIMKKIAEIKKAEKTTNSESVNTNSDNLNDSDADIQKIEKAFEQSENNKNEKSGANKNSYKDENNSQTDNEVNDNNVTISPSSTTGNSYKDNENNNEKSSVVPSSTKNPTYSHSNGNSDNQNKD